MNTDKKTTYVRIALAIDAKGDYQAAGFRMEGKDPSDDDIKRDALEYLCSNMNVKGEPHIVFVTAIVPIPLSQESIGYVDKIDKGD